MISTGFVRLAAAAAESTLSDPDELSHEETLNDAVQNLVENPEATISQMGQFMQQIGNAILKVIPTIIFAVVILIIGVIVTRFLLWLLGKGLDKTKLDLTVTKFTHQITKIILYVLLITIVLSILGIPSTSIVTLIGTAGVAIGLAIQDSLSNVAGGILLMMTKPFKIGDYIMTNGVEGTVVQISIMHTRLDSFTNQAVFIPNGLAVNATVINNSGNETRRVDMNFSISYNDDFYKAQKLILDLIDKHPKIIDDIPPTVRIAEYGESAVIIAVKVWCKTGDYWDVYFDLNEQVYKLFKENAIKIPYNQLDVHITE